MIFNLNNLKDLLKSNMDDIQKASLLLIHKAIEVGSDKMVTNHIGVRDKNGKRAGDFEVVVNKLEVTPIHHPEPIVVDSKNFPPQPGAVESNEYYVLLVDKDRDRILQIILQAFSKIQVMGLPGSSPEEVANMNEAIKSLSKDLNHKHHEKGWCTDPNCTYKSKHK